MNKRAWLRLFGAVSGIGILMIPPVLVYTLTAKAPDFGRALFALVLLAAGGHRTDGPLVLHFGSHTTCDLGLTLAMVPGAVTIWLIAPFAEYRRRDALMIVLLPVWNLYLTAKICARVVEAAKPDFIPSARLVSTER